MKVLYVALTACFFSLLVSSQGFSGEKQVVERFTLLETGIVLDSSSGLMWASRDNGEDINWQESEAFSQSFELGGYTDWRLPTIEELAGLHDPEKLEKSQYGIIPEISLTACCVWSADESMRSSAIFSFKSGRKPWGFQADSNQLRVLPVRDDRSKTFKHNR